jgi:hypothetical protein
LLKRSVSLGWNSGFCEGGEGRDLLKRSVSLGWNSGRFARSGRSRGKVSESEIGRSLSTSILIIATWDGRNCMRGKKMDSDYGRDCL